jgi:hypothetical protein
MRCPTDVHRGKNRENVRLQERNQDLEGRQKDEQAEWQNADWNQKESLSLGLDKCLGKQGKDHEQQVTSKHVGEKTNGERKRTNNKC